MGLSIEVGEPFGMPMKLTTCKTCEKQFLQRSQETHQHCRICNGSWRKEQERIREEENLKRQRQGKKNREIFEKDILKYKPIPIESIEPSDRTLYIVGNGFDLMHRVPSSYYGFRDSLGKNSMLRYTLESALTPNDIWADFENSLGKQDFDLMGGRHIVDMWLDDFGAYDEDAGAAEFYMAVEAAASPIINIVNDLQPAFRRWVSTLNIGTDDRPLEKLISFKGRVLNFNYTEFIETLYGVKDVCYIHGCRKNKKEKLILGHRPGSESVFREKVRKPRNYRQAEIALAQDNVVDLIGQYDEELTKNSREIIGNHRSFFDSLTDIDQIVVIGHSLSPVDWDYFVEVNHSVPNAHWYFGIFGLNDFGNLKGLIKELELKDYRIFRTDGISTKPNGSEDTGANSNCIPKQRVFKEENTLVAVRQLYDLLIGENLELILPNQIKKTIFLSDHIFVLLDDAEGSLLLFNKQNNCWSYIAELEGFKYQSLINRRLNYVFLAEEQLTFVYNNRVRVYDLTVGAMIGNRQTRGAKSMKYAGIDVTKKFTEKKSN